MASVIQRTNAMSDPRSARELQILLEDMRQDLVAQRAALIGALAKLDADATVTDTNYAALWTPAALKTTK